MFMSIDTFPGITGKKIKKFHIFFHKSGHFRGFKQCLPVLTIYIYAVFIFRYIYHHIKLSATADKILKHLLLLKLREVENKFRFIEMLFLYSPKIPGRQYLFWRYHHCYRLSVLRYRQHQYLFLAAINH